MAGRRVDEVPDNVFVVSSRLNSTWGGNLTDMVRARRILEVIEADDLIAHAARAGEHLHACLQALARKYPALVTNVRGRGLMCALSLPSGSVRDDVLARCRDEESLLLLGCGTDAIRWRPMLCVSDSELDLAIAKLDAVLARTV
jgi:L-lysine 6-transaminase